MTRDTCAEMGARWVVSAFVAGGCAATPANPLAGSALIDVDRTTGRVSTTSAAPMQFSIEFGDHGVRMPQSLFLDGIDRLGTEDCPFASGVGISVFPALTAAAPLRHGADATGDLTVVWPGPAIARLEVTWTSAYTCTGAPQQADGTSRFTIFPNGRIVRFDVASSSTTTLVNDGGACGCGAASNITFATFWTFTHTPVVGGDGAPWSDGSSAGCAIFPDHTIGVAWPDGSTNLFDTTAASSVVYNWAADVTMLAPMQQHVTSAIMLSNQTGAARCGDVLAELDDFPITVAGGMVVTDENGVYIDSRTHTDRVDITTTKMVPHGFAVSLDIGEVASVSRTPPAPDAGWFAVQPDGPRTVFWFRDGLAPDQTITVDPR